eukprot:TRINITY_DN10006_c0_g1_i1.p2 TRINITY_DN10006_c0_g1~~TRINITY_DN10006_c0_g1_i1.p2  ORF type:complete len:511 (+),score=134.02 TRINITY_DN10006_c0_g1_i1:96-1535(+)
MAGRRGAGSLRPWAAVAVLQPAVVLGLFFIAAAAVVARRRPGFGRCAGAILTHGAVFLVMWCWALRYPLAPPALYATCGAAYACWVVSVALGPRMRAPRPVALAAMWCTQWVWMSIPAMPFTVIWMVFTPLPLMAPRITQLGIRSALPAALWLLALLAVWQSRSPAAVSSTVVSMLHREAAFGLGARGLELRRATPARVRRPDVHYAQIAQLSDLCIGSVTTPEAARDALRAAAALCPDLVLLTGGFFAFEFAAQRSEAELDAALRRALSPLERLGERGRAYACLGEADVVLPHAAAAARSALAACGVRLLCGGTAVVSLGEPLGEVHLGAGEPGGEAPPLPLPAAGPPAAAGGGQRQPGRPLAALLQQRRAARPLSLLLAHDPDAVHAAPMDYHLVLSGRRQGGLIGLVSLGLRLTAGRLAAHVRKEPVPDHGLWARGQQRLYVSRGVGSGGLWPPWPPLRLGVPAELALLSVELPAR